MRQNDFIIIYSDTLYRTDEQCTIEILCYFDAMKLVNQILFSKELTI